MKKKLAAVVIGLALTIPALAVFNERSISRTICVLRHELYLSYCEQLEMDKRHEHSSEMEEVQRRKMVDMVEKINELMLILYSQDRNFTFDQTYALNRVMEEYDRFGKHRQPHFVNMEDIESEIERYRGLVDALKMLPPKIDGEVGTAGQAEQDTDGLEDDMADINSMLDSLVASFYESPLQPESEEEDSTEQKLMRRRSFLKDITEYNKSIRKEAADTSGTYSFVLSQSAVEDRDSCIVYANYIIESLTRLKETVTNDELYYKELGRRLQQTYDYATECYADIQDYIFDGGQENYFSVLGNMGKYVHDMMNDLQQKYSARESGPGDGGSELWGSDWRGFVLASAVFYAVANIFLVSLFVILLSCVILRKVRPFNTDFFRETRPVALLLMISVLYSLLVLVQLLFPMSNFARMASNLVLVYCWLVTTLLISVLVGMKREDVTKGLKVFLPVMTAGLVVLLLRVLFVPDKLIHLILSPVMLLFFVWQLVETLRFRTSGYKFVIILQWISLCVFGMGLIISLQGFSLLGLQVLMWWIFQITALATVVSLRYALEYYREKVLKDKKARYAASVNMVSNDEEGDFIKVTWFFDFLYKACLPIAGILSLVFCIKLSADVFNLSETCRTILSEPFFDFKDNDGSPILQVSLIKLVIVSCCFFLFRFFNYLVRSLYRVSTLERLVKNSPDAMIRKNDVNLTLAYNVIGILVWGLYMAYSIYVLKIPIGALSVVAAGLATGLGLALKDVLNNFIYGIQLMSGRLRVGDMVECDGIRGTVEKISYQSTEILTLNDSVISFTNSTLFNKNFQNLTKNSPYEFVSIVVSISYGEDVDKVRAILEQSLEGYRKKKDRYGRYLIEKRGGIWITFDEFCDSSVNLAIKQRVLVESRTAYIAEIKELVYKVFNDHGIVIPFPQQEVSILSLPERKP